MHAMICMRTGQYNAVLQLPAWKTSFNCRSAQRTSELPKRHRRSHQETERSPAAKSLWLQRKICWGALASTEEMPLIFPRSQHRTQSPSIATCWGECGVCLKEQPLWIITSEPAAQVRQQSTTYFKQREQHQNELLYVALSLSLVHKNRYIQGLDAQTLLSIPPETPLWYSRHRNNWFFSHPAYINWDRKFIALIQRQILKLCLQNFNRSTEKTHCGFLDRDCSNWTQTTKAQRHKLRTVTHAKKIIFAHITCGIRIIYTAILSPFFLSVHLPAANPQVYTFCRLFASKCTKMTPPASNDRSTFEKRICHSSLVVTKLQI